MLQKESKHALVVDDDATFCDAVAEFLVELGFLCQVATSASEAEMKINLQKFDLILSDIRMPGRDGVDLLRSIRQLYPLAPPQVLMMSGYSEWDGQQLLKLGAQNFISKPFDLESLEKLIKNN